MGVSQENGTGAVTLTGTGSLQTKYLLDGVMAAYRGSFVATAQQVASPFAGGRYALKFTIGTAQASLGANDELTVLVPFEGVRVSRLALGTAGAMPQSLGFWFQAHRAGTYSGSVRNGGKTRSYPFTFMVAAADTPTWVSLSGALAIPGDTGSTWAGDTGVGLYVSICLAGGSSRAGTAVTWAGADYSGATGTTNGVAATSDVFYLSNLIALPGIELPGADRAALVVRPFDTELALCKRYWQKSYDYAVAPGTASAAGWLEYSIGALTSNVLRNTWALLAESRGAPAVTIYDLAGTAGKLTTLDASANATNNQTINIASISTKTIGPVGVFAISCAGFRFHYVVNDRL